MSIVLPQGSIELQRVLLEISKAIVLVEGCGRDLER